MLKKTRVNDMSASYGRTRAGVPEGEQRLVRIQSIAGSSPAIG
jgi:hypothetical protein